MKVIDVDATDYFLGELAGVKDPEVKRKRIGLGFIKIFEEEAHKIGQVKYLAQGTLYPDVIESVSFRGEAPIKSHHNVGGLPEIMKLDLIEPLRELFKDEVRELGLELGLPEEAIYRQPFPGPGLGIRIMGEVTGERLRILRQADVIVLEEMRKAGWYRKVWQSFAVLLPIQTVGVMGDGRTYEHVIAIRAVDSRDAMTADWTKLPYEILGEISSRIINEVRGVNRVVYDIQLKTAGNHRMGIADDFPAGRVMGMLKTGIYVDAENIRMCGGYGMRYDVLVELANAGNSTLAARQFLPGGRSTSGPRRIRNIGKNSTAITM